MSPSLKIRGLLVAGAVALGCPVLVSAQSGVVAQAGEYAPVGNLPGDQVYPQVAVKASGGYVVWPDNVTDGLGLGVSAQRLDENFSGVFSPFRVNVSGADDQENPHVALLNDGGAAFVWQGGKQSFQRIYARFLSSSNTWVTGDVQVNTFTNDFQKDPVVATLNNGNVVVAWSSWNEESAGSMQGVYARLLSPWGVSVGGEIPVNQATAYNQRTPAVAALSTGGFVLAWVSEQQRFANGVDIYARLFNADGSAAGNEFLVNTSTNVCANPSVAVAADGGFAIAWGEKDAVSPRTNSWDVYARAFSGAGVGGPVRRLNTRLFGDQFAPKISFSGTNYLVVWTSMGQDGSREGVYSQALGMDVVPVGGEFRVNTTTASQQIHPALAGDGAGRFLAVWTSFGGGVNSFDLRAQRYDTGLLPLTAPSTPFVTVLSSTNLMVTWPALAGFSVANYEVYADGAATATAVVTNNWWIMNGLAPASPHTFRLVYVLTDSRRSPLSAAASGTTWGSLNWGGIPFEWMTQFFGSDISKWPAASADSDGDGVSNLNEFLAGTNPGDANSVLRTALTSSPQGLFLSWNTQPGLIYQVQTSTEMQGWTAVGAARFAAGAVDSIYVGKNGRGYYRILRLR